MTYGLLDSLRVGFPSQCGRNGNDLQNSPRRAEAGRGWGWAGGGNHAQSLTAVLLRV